MSLESPAVRCVRWISSAGRPALRLVFILVVSGCAHQESTMKHITANALQNRMDSGQAPVIIDVRSGWEYSKGHVPGAVHIPFWSMFWRADDLDLAPKETLVVYCEHGPRAGIARLALRNAGFATVLYLQGHMARWRKEGFPVESVPPE